MRSTDLGAQSGPVETVTQNTIVDFPETPVAYVAGDRERPIHEQAPVAFRTLEASLPTLRGRRFFAALVGPEYRACVAVHAEEDSAGATLSRWVIPGGRYARRKIRDYHTQVPAIGENFAEMRCRTDYDPSRPCVEVYRSQHDMYVMVPVR
jgi:DNA gyrase inhibitor GyrI